MKNKNILSEKLGSYPLPIKNPEQVFNEIQNKLKRKRTSTTSIILFTLVLLIILSGIILSQAKTNKTIHEVDKITKKISRQSFLSTRNSNSYRNFTVSLLSDSEMYSAPDNHKNYLYNSHSVFEKYNRVENKPISKRYQKSIKNNSTFFKEKFVLKKMKLSVSKSKTDLDSTKNKDNNNSLMDKEQSFNKDNNNFLMDKDQSLDSTKNRDSSNFLMGKDQSFNQTKYSLEKVMDVKNMPVFIAVSDSLTSGKYKDSLSFYSEKQLIRMKKSLEKTTDVSIFIHVSPMGIKNTFSMGSGFTPNHLDSLYLQKRESEDRFTFGFQTGLGCRIKIKKYFSITAELNYSYLNYIEAIPSSGPFISIGPYPGEYTKSRESFEIPVTIGVNIPIRKFAINIDMGVAPSYSIFVSYFSKSPGSAYMESGEGWFGKGTPYANSFNLHLIGNVLFSYSLNNHWKVFGGFTSRYALISSFNSMNTVTQNSYGFGGKCGLEYQF